MVWLSCSCHGFFAKFINYFNLMLVKEININRQVECMKKIKK